MTQAHKKMKDERPDRRVRVRGVQRKDPDPKRIGEVVVALALAQAEKEAQEAKRRRDERRSA
jgi:hypothetical protein